MLSIEKVKIYQRFNGDSDGFYRSGRKDGDGIDHQDWMLIDEFRLGLHAVLSGLASPEFAQAIERRLQTFTTDEKTREALRELAKQGV